VIEATAPVRICDIGGWTDTWFGGPGRVVNVAVTPGVDVSIRTTTERRGVVLDVHAFGDRYPVVPGATREARHPLLEAAIDARPPPPDLAVEIGVRSRVPAGCGAGTSASVAVALLGALTMARGDVPVPMEIAPAAHRLEVDVLRAESGIQDQISAAFGGVSFLEIERYPDVTVHTLPAWDGLGDRVTLVFLGRPHDSSNVHRAVIEHAGARAAVFARLRAAAVAARAAVLARDFDAFGDAMIVNTEAQRDLHPALVGPDAEAVIAMAAAGGAIGWKVNGAGGDGGSVTLLSRSGAAKAQLDARIDAHPTARVLPIEISSVGLVVRGSLSPPSSAGAI
jgi:D-glycero-alpha-D-manno-heptose-7-phosphate kinase